MQENIQEEVKYPQMQVEEPEFCKLQVHYVADPAVVESKIEEAIQTLRKVKIPGFRQGKAPDQAIKIKLKPQIDNYVANAMASHAIDDIVFENDIKIISRPDFTNVALHGKNFHCDVSLFKKPSFELSNIKFDLEKPKQNQSEDELVSKSLENLQKTLGERYPYEENDTVAFGDQVTFSFTSTIDELPFDGSVIEGEMYQIGQDRWNGFDNYLIGMKAEETREFDFVFEDGTGELSGKTAHFSVTIHMGTKVKPADINEEFFTKLGVKDLNDLNDKLKQVTISTVKRNENNYLRGQVAKKLIEENVFDVPDIMVDRESRTIAANGGVKDFESLTTEQKEQIKNQATASIKLSLIVDSIRDREPDSILNNNEAQNHLIQHITSQGQDPNKLFGDPKMQYQLAVLIQQVKDEFTLQWVLDQCNTSEAA